MRLTFFMVLLAWSSWLPAYGSDVGLVNMVTGEVAYVSASKATGKARPFMTVREGDRFNLSSGSQLKVVFFDGGRQEIWQGPASFRAGRSATLPIAGKPTEATNLPVGAAQRIAHVPDLMQHARLGGIQVRGTLTRKQEASLQQQENIREARATYAQMQKTAPADDITPELYLYAALYEYLMYSEMSTVVEEMQRKQPNNDDVKALAAWVKTRTPK